MSYKGGESGWSTRHNAYTKAAQAIIDEEAKKRAAKTERLRRQRRALAEGQGKAPDALNASNDE